MWLSNEATLCVHNISFQLNSHDFPDTLLFQATDPPATLPAEGQSMSHLRLPLHTSACAL